MKEPSRRGFGALARAPYAPSPLFLSASAAYARSCAAKFAARAISSSSNPVSLTVALSFSLARSLARPPTDQTDRRASCKRTYESCAILEAAVRPLVRASAAAASERGVRGGGGGAHGQPASRLAGGRSAGKSRARSKLRAALRSRCATECTLGRRPPSANEPKTKSAGSNSAPDRNVSLAARFHCHGARLA